ncbi:uncharacterized protein LOC108157364 [Drosophila miranda]|uniref:uncharacterized protein LOC108157364 n=1 Tax=Drosophila miranda TaxID=7229 RepID=UPI0007E669CD|nr:uncharacterized protein LOC108157364 [Drosophila miranda]
MSSNKVPFFAVIKCEMCINPATNFVVGLCQRCEKIWAKSPEYMPLTNHRVMAAMVASERKPDSPMDPTFQTAMMNARKKKAQKIALFHKIRGQFTNSVLVDTDSKMAEPFKTEDNYWDIPEIMDEDVMAFQRNVDLLADMVPDRTRSDKDKDKDATDKEKDTTDKEKDATDKDKDATYKDKDTTDKKEDSGLPE